jgi:hypothetical protein
VRHRHHDELGRPPPRSSPRSRQTAIGCGAEDTGPIDFLSDTAGRRPAPRPRHASGAILEFLSDTRLRSAACSAPRSSGRAPATCRSRRARPLGGAPQPARPVTWPSAAACGWMPSSRASSSRSPRVRRAVIRARTPGTDARWRRCGGPRRDRRRAPGTRRGRVIGDRERHRLELPVGGSVRRRRVVRNAVDAVVAARGGEREEDTELSPARFRHDALPRGMVREQVPPVVDSVRDAVISPGWWWPSSCAATRHVERDRPRTRWSATPFVNCHCEPSACGVAAWCHAPRLARHLRAGGSAPRPSRPRGGVPSRQQPRHQGSNPGAVSPET